MPRQEAIRRNTTTGHNLTLPMSQQRLTPSLARHSQQQQQQQIDAQSQPNYAEYLQLLPAVNDTPIFTSGKKPTHIGLKGHLSGQFSLSPTGPTDGGEEDRSPSDKSTNTSPNSDKSASPNPPLELTFYRRNLFQISCTVTNARSEMFAQTSSSKGGAPELSRIVSLSMQVSVIGSDESKKPKLLYTPPKPAADKQEQIPSIKPLWPKDNAHSEVIDWKRLQFRSATAHNGRRRLQNYFTLSVGVFAELENRQRVPVVHAQSRHIVVRGRNPQFYKNRPTIAISDTHVRSTGSFSSELPVINRPPSIKEEGRKTPDSVSQSSEDEDDLQNPRPLSDGMESPPKKTKYDDSYVEENEKARYEYYPMPSAYYQPPVDVVYRPHAVKHSVPSMESSLKRQFTTVA